MSYNDQHNVNKALRDVFHMRGLRGASRAYEVELPLIQKTIRELNPRTKPRMTAVNATGGFGVTRKGRS